jgi:hypothetical protein
VNGIQSILHRAQSENLHLASWKAEQRDQPGLTINRKPKSADGRNVDGGVILPKAIVLDTGEHLPRRDVDHRRTVLRAKPDAVNRSVGVVGAPWREFASDITENHFVLLVVKETGPPDGGPEG